MAGPAGFASSEARSESSLFDFFETKKWLDRQDSHRALARSESSLFDFFETKKWLGKIKQALTIYKEDIRNRLDKFNSEDWPAFQ